MNFLGKIITGLFGGGGNSTQIIEKLDEAILSKQERFEMDAKDLESVRNYLNTPAGPGFISQAIDAVNRSVRPVVTYWLLGGMIGWWALPTMEMIPPFMQALIYLVVTFWFGGRVVMQDVPKMLKSLKDLRSK